MHLWFKSLLQVFKKEANTQTKQDTMTVTPLRDMAREPPAQVVFGNLVHRPLRDGAQESSFLSTRFLAFKISFVVFA